MDAEYSRKLAIQSLLQSEGFKFLKERISEFTEVENYEISKILGGAVHENLQELNFHLGKKKAYESFAFIEEELKEELSEKSTEMSLN